MQKARVQKSPATVPLTQSEYKMFTTLEMGEEESICSSRKSDYSSRCEIFMSWLSIIPTFRPFPFTWPTEFVFWIFYWITELGFFKAIEPALGSALPQHGESQFSAVVTSRMTCQYAWLTNGFNQKWCKLYKIQWRGSWDFPAYFYTIVAFFVIFQPIYIILPKTWNKK